MHSSSSKLIQHDNHDQGKDRDDDSKEKPSSFNKKNLSFFTITDVRKRQIIITILFVANFFFINWLVDGDPTQGELLRITQVLNDETFHQQQLEQHTNHHQEKKNVVVKVIKTLFGNLQ